VLNLFLCSLPTDLQREKYEEAARRLLYQALGLKRILLSTSPKLDEDEEQSGLKYVSINECNKNTPRCFPSIVDDMPDYLYRGR
jgi:hypothetical protein